MVAALHARQVRFVALDLGIDTATPAGRAVLGLFAALAGYGRESIHERATAGMRPPTQAGPCKRLVQNVIVCWNCLCPNQ
ncbi:hypothetical protein GCM10027348_40520 [Hymenobacter tenuis]